MIPMDKAYDERALAGNLLVAMTRLWKGFKQVWLPLTTISANAAMYISSHPIQDQLGNVTYFFKEVVGRVESATRRSTPRSVPHDRRNRGSPQWKLVFVDRSMKTLRLKSS